MTIEFLHLADLHFSNCLPYTTIDPEKGYNKRFHDQLRCFEYACNYARSKGDLPILISGDIFHYHNPSSRERTVVAQLLDEYSDTLKILIMNGNHDVGGRGWSALGDLAAFSSRNVWIYCDANIHHDVVCMPDTTIVIVPFRKDQTLKEIDDYCNIHKLDRDVLMLHDSIIGADYGFGKKSVDGFSISDLFNLGFKYIAMGHFHKWHHWKKDGRWIVYTGSVIPRDFHEFNSQTKYFSHVTFGDAVSVKRVPYPKVNKLYKLYLDNKFKPNKLLCGEDDVGLYTAENLKGSLIKVIYPKTEDNKHKSVDFSRISDELKKRGASFVILEPDTKQEVLEYADIGSIDSDQLSLSNLIKEYCNEYAYDTEYPLNILEGHMNCET